MLVGWCNLLSWKVFYIFVNFGFNGHLGAVSKWKTKLYLQSKTACWFQIIIFNTSFFHSNSLSWYHEGMDRNDAESMLQRIPYDGTFIVRRSESDTNAFAISFRWWRNTGDDMHSTLPWMCPCPLPFVHLPVMLYWMLLHCFVGKGSGDGQCIMLNLTLKKNVRFGVIGAKKKNIATTV